MKTVITTEDFQKIYQSVLREKMKDQGFFDGRFKNKSFKSKKTYSRSKNKKIDFEIKIKIL